VSDTAGAPHFQRSIGQAARAARTERGLKLVRVAAAANLSEATLGRFERGETWPQSIDAVLAAYESELGLEPRAILRRAAEM
jgi:transcriptional regulator with XRE-family HTH domain